MYDAVIVGGRCAGSPLAMLLAGAGHKVLVVDRATFPSDTMSTHFVQSPGVARLTRWGLIDEVLATNCPTVHNAHFDVGGDVTEFEIPLNPGLPGLVAPRRHLLDKLLVDAAVAAGAELAEGVLVDSLSYDGDRVTGIEGHSSDGPFQARSRIVVGADGRHSVVARETGTPFAQYEDPVTAGYYAYFRDLDGDAVEMYLRDGLFSVVFPTNDGLTTVALAWPKDRFREIRRNVEENFMSTLDGLGDLGERARAGERAERFVGAADLPNYLREPSGPGWALVGDAYFHKDPAPADGITDAFRAAEYLAEAIDEILTRATDEEAALTEYRRRHDAIAAPQLEPAVRLARFDVTPQERVGGFFEIRLQNEEEVRELLQNNISQ